MATDPDRDLVEAARRGERGAFEGLYELHKGRLYGYLVRVTGSPAAADDVFQEVWMKAMAAFERFDPERGSFRAWLFRIAANAAIDRARYEYLRSGPELDAPLGEEGRRRIDAVESPAADPERAAGAREATARLAVALRRLPPAQRTAVLLRHQLGFSYRELALALSAPEGTVKALVHRGIKALRRQWPEFDQEPSDG